MDLCFTTAISMIFPWTELVIFSVLIFFVHLGPAAYFQYFRRPLSALTL